MKMRMKRRRMKEKGRKKKVIKMMFH